MFAFSRYMSLIKKSEIAEQQTQVGQLKVDQQKSWATKSWTTEKMINCKLFNKHVEHVGHHKIDQLQVDQQLLNN